MRIFLGGQNSTGRIPLPPTSVLWVEVHRAAHQMKILPGKQDCKSCPITWLYITTSHECMKVSYTKLLYGNSVSSVSSCPGFQAEFLSQNLLLNILQLVMVGTQPGTLCMQVLYH